MESPMMAVCACSHTARRHDEEGACKAAACGCLVLRPEGQLEPVLPDVPSSPAVVVPINVPVITRTTGRAVELVPEPCPDCVKASVVGVDGISVGCCDAHAEQDESVDLMAPLLASVEAAKERRIVLAGLVAEPEASVSVPRTMSDLLEAGRRSPNKRTRVVAEKAMTLLVDLRRALEEEAVAESARGRIAELERQLAEERSKLRAARPPAGSFACDVEQCGHAFGTRQGLAMHRFRAHGLRGAS